MPSRWLMRGERVCWRQSVQVGRISGRSTEAIGGGSGTMIHGIYQMTPRQFRKAIDAGVFGENLVELLGGIPFSMSQKPPHSFASRRLLVALQALAAPPRWVVDKETTLALGRWRPLA